MMLTLFMVPNVCDSNLIFPSFTIELLKNRFFFFGERRLEFYLVKACLPDKHLNNELKYPPSIHNNL